MYCCCKGVSTIKADFPASVLKAKLQSNQGPIPPNSACCMVIETEAL